MTDTNTKTGLEGGLTDNIPTDVVTLSPAWKAARKAARKYVKADTAERKAKRKADKAVKKADKARRKSLKAAYMAKLKADKAAKDDMRNGLMEPRPARYPFKKLDVGNAKTYGGMVGFAAAAQILNAMCQLTKDATDEEVDDDEGATCDALVEAFTSAFAKRIEERSGIVVMAR